MPELKPQKFNAKDERLTEVFGISCTYTLFDVLAFNTSNEQNVRSYYMLNHGIRGLLSTFKKLVLFIGFHFLVRVTRNIRIPSMRMTLEIRYRQNLAKLKRVINENKWKQAKG